MEAILRVENLGKQYRIGARHASYNTLREALTNAARAPFTRFQRNGGKREKTIWALRDVSFEVQYGQVMGIVGSNGAGKSTLLKILSRITEPTEGRAELRGRVGSLLEVGTGFHPELTGRENVYLNGAVLGMKRAEINRKFDEIVAFSEIEKFIDTPVKFYSSGMYMRLAFAVAAHLESEILIVDEVLAVGDMVFQKKCLGKIGSVAQAGRTVLFVSHNMIAVQSLCDRALLLENGTVRESGSPAQVVSKYLATSFSAVSEQLWEDPETAPGNDQVRVRRASVRAAADQDTDQINVHTPLVIEFEFWNMVADAYLHLSVIVNGEAGEPIFNTGSGNDPAWCGKPFPCGLFRSAFYIPGDLLNNGTHRVGLLVVKDQTSVIFQFDDVLVFEVEDSSRGRGAWYGKWLGAVRPKLQWRTQLLSAETGAAPLKAEEQLNNRKKS